MVLQLFVWNIENQDLYPYEISGFREDRSSVLYDIALMSDIIGRKCAKNITIAVFLDITEAFDSVTREAIRREITFWLSRAHAHLALELLA